MSKLINPLQDILAQASQIEISTLEIDRYSQRIDPKDISQDSLLLLDISESMNESISTGIRKIDLLRRAVNRPLAVQEKAIAFNSSVFPLDRLQDIPDPFGGTALHLAIQHCFSLRPKQTLIICDGEPDDRSS
jgi:hypothetical protein